MGLDITKAALAAGHKVVATGSKPVIPPNLPRHWSALLTLQTRHFVFWQVLMPLQPPSK
jgi:hypothetical protein